VVPRATELGTPLSARPEREESCRLPFRAARRLDGSATGRRPTELVPEQLPQTAPEFRRAPRVDAYALLLVHIHARGGLARWVIRAAELGTSRPVGTRPALDPISPVGPPGSVMLLSLREPTVWVRTGRWT
jgi:hypothetical protein